MSRLYETLRRMDGPGGAPAAFGTLPLRDPAPAARPRRLLAAALVVVVAAAAGVALAARQRPPVTPTAASAVPSVVAAAPLAGAVTPVPTAPARSGPDVGELLREGVAAARGHDLDRARSLLERVVAAEPAAADAWNALGVVRARTGDSAGAAEAFRRALQFSPEDADAHRNLAIALERQGRLGEALGHYRAFLKAAGESHSDHGQVRQRVDALAARTGGRP
jgi:tetratricopeptide (TPR) repeat protein